MPQSKGLGRKYPSTFCEWVVGQSIESAFGNRPKKPSTERKIVTVEVTTDDETDEDSLRITYPRSGRSTSTPKTAASVKKVRFADAPRKPAIKMTTASSQSPDDSTSESTTSSKPDEEVTSSDASSEKSPKGRTDKKSNGKATGPDSDFDPEPHPTCKCARCARGRRKLRKRAQANQESESEASGSEAEKPPIVKNRDMVKAKKKGTKNAGEKKDESDDADEESESAKTSEEESDTKKTKKGTGKNEQEPSRQNANAKKQQQQQNKDNADKKGDNQKGKAQNKKPAQPQREPDSMPEKATAGNAKDERTADRVNKKNRRPRTDNKSGDYPEAFLAPHPRRPNLIEPIRAEVVQTERVVESPEDPPPNAYYDPEHGVLRVYHGPVYGRSQGYALYPRRDASGRPLPVGMMHPLQNPYYYGFHQAAPQQGQEHVPITQGMPVASYNAMCPPPTFAPSCPGGAPPNWRPWEGQAPYVNPEANVDSNHMNRPNGNKGAFSMSGAIEGSSSGEHKDVDGANNVAPPGSVKKQSNPYYKPRVSPFSTYGSRVPSQASQRSALQKGPWPNTANTGMPSTDGADNDDQGADGAARSNAQDGGAWPENNTGQTQDGWGDNAGWSNDVGLGNVSSSQTDVWKDMDGGDGGGSGSGGNVNDGSANDGGNWGNQEAQPTDETGNGTSQWLSPGEAADQPPAMEANNGMPGSWDAQPAAAPGWADTTVAADSGGLVDRPDETSW